MFTRYFFPVAALGLTALATTSIAEAGQMKLTAEKVTAPITIDGTQDAAWNSAAPLTVTTNELPYRPNNGYSGITRTDVELRALYDDQHLYMLVRYADPTKSLARFPWQKQSDGSWKILHNKDNTGHDNTYYEDKVALLWNINTRGYKKKGCDISCHMAENGILEGVKDKAPGRHFTRSEGEYLDAWHWKSVRSNPNHQMDDQFFNWNHQEAKSWGRHSDKKTGGGYYYNKNKDKTAPAYMPKTLTETPTYWIKDDEKVPFIDNFQTGDRIAGIITAPFEGPRGDITAFGAWKGGVWTLEIKRKLVTTGEGAKVNDVQFTDLTKPYYFGVTVFDNSQINHLYHKKSIALTFANPTS